MKRERARKREELDDGDIIEVIETAPEAHRSGTYTAVRPPPLPPRRTSRPLAETAPPAPAPVEQLILPSNLDLPTEIPPQPEAEAAHEEPPPRSHVAPALYDLPRLGSIPDTETNVSDMVSEIALLSDPTSMPRITGGTTVDLSPQETLLVTLVTANMSVQAITDVSPLGEEETLRVLTSLVRTGVITVVKSDEYFASI